jgi:hypothetical protein
MARIRPGRISRFVADLRVEPGRKVRLPRDFDPAKTTRGVSVCLQAMDAAGKDSAIRHVMSGANPQGVDHD